MLAKNCNYDHIGKACALHEHLVSWWNHLLRKYHQTRFLGLLLGVPIRPHLEGHEVLRPVLLRLQITYL